MFGILFFSLIFNFAWARQQETLHDGQGHLTVQVDVLSSTEADDLFRAIAKQSHIPFRFPVTCCNDRAFEMGRVAQKLGYNTGQIVAEGFPLRSHFDGIYESVEWIFHVAAFVQVEQAGKRVPMVIDPGLFNKPVTVDDWKKKLSAPGIPGDPPASVKESYFQNRFASNPGEFNTQSFTLDKISQTGKSLTECLKWQNNPESVPRTELENSNVRIRR